jgi:hypothetical protein
VKEVLWSIPKARRDSKEFAPFKRKLIGLVVLNFIVLAIASALFATSSMGISALNFDRLHFSIIAISPVYISFSILEMLQKFIHGPFNPVRPEASALNEGDFVVESNSPQGQVHTSRMDIESSVRMQDFDGTPNLENYSSGMHDSDLEDSSMGVSDQHWRGRWFKGGRGKTRK